MQQGYLAAGMGLLKSDAGASRFEVQVVGFSSFGRVSGPSPGLCCKPVAQMGLGFRFRVLYQNQTTQGSRSGPSSVHADKFSV